MVSIQGFDISKKKCRCNICRNDIIKGSYRGFQEIHFRGNYSKSFYCVACCRRFIEILYKALIKKDTVNAYETIWNEGQATRQNVIVRALQG